MEIAIISRERESSLLDCVLYITKNTILPNCIIIVKAKSFKDQKKFFQIKDLLARKKIKLNYQEIDDLGISYSRNIALSMIKSNFFAFIDDDEYCYPDWIESAKKTLRKHPEVMAVTGYKEIYYKNNYWNLVWKELCKEAEYNPEGYVEFATSSNTFYRTQFIKNHKLKYDNDFRSSSEDLVFSQKIKSANGVMWYTPQVRVKHKFRTLIIDMIKQWFDYGKTIYLFKKKYIVSKKNKNAINFKRFIFQGIKVKRKALLLIPGLIIIDLSLFCGYLYKAFLILVKKIKLS